MKLKRIVIFSFFMGNFFQLLGFNVNDFKDKELLVCLEKEQERQDFGTNLIASENLASDEVRFYSGSVFCNKYTEGYPNRRYYSGCKEYDYLENITIDRFKKLFGAEHVNVQPHSGSQANAAVYLALLDPGDTILSMDLACGGHLSHGHKVNWTSQIYNIVPYGVDPVLHVIDYDAVEELAMKHKPKIIIAGASSYSRSIDFERFGAIAKKSNSILMADIAHIAGLVAAGLHPSPFPHADVVTMTTHKTFRGPRGGVIMSKKDFGQKIDRMIIPGLQGGALMNHIAAKAVACLEALQPSFIDYQKQVIENASSMAQEFFQRGYDIIAQGSDNHMFLVDLTATGLNGKEVEKVLETLNIFVNRNTIPYDKQPPLRPSGMRIGTATITTQGAKKKEALKIVDMIDRAIKNHNNEDELERIKKEVKALMVSLKTD